MDAAGNNAEGQPGQKQTDPSKMPSTTDLNKPKPKSKSVFKEAEKKSRRKGKPGKIHIRLPAIEAYEKEICFPADAPGRVVVRLERLMGSDKIRPVDEKYMSTLIQRLEEEESFKFDRKIRLRKKAETERHRQLAINGLMEPGPGMEDLYNHPVFRVNRILSRLSRLDNSFANKPGEKLPRISQIDPFKYDDNGKYFCDYPTHVALRKQCEKDIKRDEKHDEQLLEDLEELEDALAGNEVSKSYTDYPQGKKSRLSTAPPPPSEVSVAIQKEAEDESETDEELEAATTYEELEDIDEEEEDEGELTEMDEVVLGLSREYMESLTSLQNRYGVPQSDGFEEMWKPYRSDLIEKFYSDEVALEELYDSTKEIFEVYIRQDLTSREYVKTTPLKLPKELENAEEEEGDDEEGYGESTEIEYDESSEVQEDEPDLTAPGEVSVSNLAEGEAGETEEDEAEEQDDSEVTETAGEGDEQLGTLDEPAPAETSAPAEESALPEESEE